MADPVVGAAVVGLVDTVVGDFFGASGVVEALAGAAGELAAAEVAGTLASVLPVVEQALRDSAAIQAGVDVTVTDAVGGLLGDAALWQDVGGTLTTLVTNLLDNAVVQQYVGATVAGFIAAALNDSPIAEPVGQTIGAAVETLLAAPGVGSGLGIIVGAVLPDLFGQTGVPTALGTAAGQLAVAAVAGGQAAVAAVLPEVEAALWADPDVQAGVRATIADALNLVDTTLLSVPDIQRALGAVVTTSITDLAASEAVRTFLADQIGPPFGGAVADLLANSNAVNDIASALGSAVTEFLGYPGFSTALTDAADQFANALLDGDAVAEALQIAVQYLESDAAYLAAVNAIVPDTVSGLLADPVVRAAIGVVAKDVVIAELKGIGIDNRFLDGVAGQVAEGTVDWFLLKTAAITLIDSLAVDILTGTPLGDVTTIAIQQVIQEPALQIALGVSIGQGIGSLFGDNLIGDLIGLVAAVPATLVVGVASGIALIYQWLFGGPSLSVNQTASPSQGVSGESQPFQPLPAAADLFVMRVSVPVGQDVGVSGAATVADNPFTLVSLEMTGPNGDQPGAVDVTMTVDSGAAQGGQASPGPLLVAFTFPLDRLIPTMGSPSPTVADARTFQQIS